MTKSNFLWLAFGVILLLLGLFILTDLYDRLIDYAAYVLIALGVVIIVATVAYMGYLVRRAA